MEKNNTNFWEKVEENLATKVETHLKNLLQVCGYRDALTIKSLSDEDIDYIENFARTRLPAIIHNRPDKIDLNLFYGKYYAHNPAQFEFLLGEKKQLREIAAYVLSIVNRDGNFTAMHYFSDSQIDHGNQTISNTPKIKLEFSTRTHYFLGKLLEAANRNLKRKPGGYRYDGDVRRFSAYLRMLAGPLTYDTIQKNLACALPSLASTNKYITTSNYRISEGILRSEELLLYLKERNLPLVVSLSEDATKIIGRIEYDSKTNQLIGFVLPINKQNGLPIPFSFNARNAPEILKHFNGNNNIGSLINVIMAQPIGKVRTAPFCLMLFCSDNKYDTNDVCRRWKFIAKSLNSTGIEVLTFSSDSDPKYNAAMRRLSTLGKSSNYFPGADWFSCGSRDLVECFPVMIQDTPHIGTKMRNFFLKTIRCPMKLPFGEKLFIDHRHLRYLVDNFGKDKHNLTPTSLNPADRQNFHSVLRMCDSKVIELLRSSVVGSYGTIKYLEIMRNIIESFMNINLSPLDRVKKLWYATFMVRFWRRYVVSAKGLTLKENFLTANCYSCIELNAHGLIIIMLHLKKVNKPELFMPFLFDSQPCESTFRKIRSFSTVYSTISNCSVKEVLHKISKIGLQTEIINEISSDFKFPRLGQSNGSNYGHTDLPTLLQIRHQIEESKLSALKDAIKLGIFHKNDNLDLSCHMKPLKKNSNEKQIIVDYLSNDDNSEQASPKFENLGLKNFAHLFTNATENNNVPENSIFVEIPTKSLTRMIVKKSSLCWLLRKEASRLSSDRLYRVMAPGCKSIKNKFKKQKKYGLKPITKKYISSTVRKY